MVGLLPGGFGSEGNRELWRVCELEREAGHYLSLE